jgi:hypothetical protein
MTMPIVRPANLIAKFEHMTESQDVAPVHPVLEEVPPLQLIGALIYQIDKERTKEIYDTSKEFFEGRVNDKDDEGEARPRSGSRLKSLRLKPFLFSNKVAFCFLFSFLLVHVLRRSLTR